MEQEKVRIPVEDNISIEGVIHRCKGDISDENLKWKDIGIIVTHPMPAFGGDMRNNVVVAVSSYFSRLGATTLRINFRGVGNSGGSGSWRGGTEREDLKKCCQYLLNHKNNENEIKKIILIGYSYGSVISSSVANEIEEVIGYVAISYPFGPLTLMLLWHLLPLAQNCSKPKYFIMGSDDNFTGSSNFNTQIKSFSEPIQHLLLDNIDHFWNREEKLLCDNINTWVTIEIDIFVDNNHGDGDEKMVMTRW
eukprot:TRINITY_DN889_c0_g1_i6.p1 TRINITY_DN889_c0_g1~~TRINITY_DN889_c0_g1_i6.p1  ORF type:complete len:250 (-),score=39.15 TRINITY_DN889_c0_g1_i6:15-764(-)